MEIKRTFEELHQVATKYHNDRGFCGVIAVATACNISFSKAYYKMQAQGRKRGRGSSPKWYQTVIKNRGFDLKLLLNEHNRIEYYGCHVKTLPQKLPKGTYLIQVSGHVLCMVDGVINDWSKDRALRVKEIIEVIKKK
tara:strand:+ start:415 stop:828 length:414 start_codon:yes stop_codon:yes gene_type:complete